MKLKTLAAAALAFVAASQAFAAIQVTTNGNSELFFVLGNDKGSFVLDTGLTVNALKSASFTSYVKDVTGLTGFSSFVAGTTPQWALAVFDGSGTAGFGSVDMISTYNTSLPAITANGSINNTTFKSSVFNNTGLIAQSTITTGDHASVANGSSFNAFGTAGYFGSGFFQIGQPTDFLGNAVGTTSNLVEWKGNGTSSLNKVATSYLTGYTASFNGTTVTVSAVPEPSSYAMLIAGLAAVGFVARRRTR